MPNLTPEKADQLVRKHFAERLAQANEVVFFAGDKTAYDREDEIALAERDEKAFREHVATRMHGPVTRHQARRLLESAGIPTDESSEAFDQLCNRILRAEAELSRIYGAKLRAAYAETVPLDPMLCGIVSDDLPPLPGEESPASRRALAATADEYHAFKAAHAWAPKTAVENRRALDWLCDVVGPDRLIGSLATEDIKRFRDVLLKLPANYAKQAKFEGMSLEQVAKQYKGKKTLSATSVKKYFANNRSAPRECGRHEMG